MHVQQGWTIRTYVESSVKMRFETGSVVQIGEKSAVTISAAVIDQAGTSSGTSVNMLTGKLWSNVKKLASKKSTFEVETPTAVASIRGTRFGVYTGSNKTAVDVHSGSVRVRAKGSSAYRDVVKGKRAVVSGDDKNIRLYDLQKDKDKLPGPPPEDALQDDTTATGAAMPDTADAPAGADTAVADTAVMDSVVSDTTVQQGDTTGTDSTLSAEDASMPDTTVPDTTGAVEPPVAPDTGATAVDTGTGFSSMPDSLPQTPAADTLSAAARADTSAGNTRGPLLLQLTSPQEGSTVRSPSITVSGRTTPGAEVTANGITVAVQPQGGFSATVPIPDEEQVYTVTVEAQLDGRTKTQQRRVEYKTEQQALSLDLAGPQDDEQITGNAIPVRGRAPGADRVTVNGRRVGISSSGYFTYQVPLSERDIGDYTVQVVAGNNENEIEQERTVRVVMTSPRVNTSRPRIQVLNASMQATRQRELRVNVLDRTPGDIITLSVECNASVEEYEVESGTTQGVYLEKGENTYVIRARDMAGNQANPVSGEIFYLPGPLQMTVIEPHRTRMVIDDLPPMPSAQIRTPLTIEVELDDGINDVPETIKYCRISGSGVNQLLDEKGDYEYGTTVQLSDGMNRYTIVAEDIAGNRVTRAIEVDIR
jgi:hypothetical protein